MGTSLVVVKVESADGDLEGLDVCWDPVIDMVPEVLAVPDQ